MTTTYDVMVDIDDVIIPTIDSIHALALEAGLHDGSVEPAWTGWEVYGCTPERYWALWTQWADDGGYLETPPIPGAAEALRRLHWEGHRIHLVTARGFMKDAERIRAWTPQWIENFAIPNDSLTFSQDKVGAQSELGVRFDFAVDDSPSNWAKLSADGVPAALLEHPHNRHAWCEIGPEFRVANLDEFADRILEAASRG